MLLLVFVVTVAAALCCTTQAELIDFETIGGIPDEFSADTAKSNGDLFNKTVNSLRPSDTLFFRNKTYYMLGGIKAANLVDVTFQIDGTISFSNDRDSWPKKADGSVEECIYFENISNITFTSSGKGTLDGNGQPWWGAIKFLKYQEDRPRLMHIKGSKNVLVENLLFKDSPYWTFYAEDSDGLLVRYTDVSNRITNIDKHTLIDLQAFNTDGFDVTGKNVYIHDCNIWCQDDCISVKDGSQDMFFERITCSGLGLVIGSIGESVVRNITFRDCYLPNTFKGIYMKTRWSDKGPADFDDASISNILYENIVMDAPEQYAIWMGPAQQTGQPCDLTWPQGPHSECRMSGFQTWDNITLRNVTINNPKGSPGVLLGNDTNPMKNVVFDGVVVNNPGDEPWGDDFYLCEGVEGTAIGTTPMPPCFTVGRK